MGKIREKLEAMEGQETPEKRGDEDDSGKRRNRGRESGVREWTQEDDDEMGNMVDPYYEL